jgi:hypothetical protein
MVREGREKLSGIVEVDETYIGGEEIVNEFLKGMTVPQLVLVFYYVFNDSGMRSQIRTRAGASPRR